MAWTRADIRSTFRDLTGRSTTAEISDADCNSRINDYYRFDFCEVIQLQEFKSDWTQECTVDDNGEYTLGEDVLQIEEPIFVNDEKLPVYYDKDAFFSDFPSQEDYLTAPTLAIGSSSTAAVAISAFKYQIAGWTYAKAAVETALSGDTVPQDKYGAWLLEIDVDGTIAVQEAGDNATGYASPGRAVDALPGHSDDCITIGFVIAINTSGTFVPGTTGLDASGVTDTYTDGDPGLRGAPVAVLADLSNGKLFIEPKVNDTYLLKAKMSLQRPTALSADSDEPTDTKWGLALALGSAIKYLSSLEGEQSRINELRYGTNPMNPAPGTLDYELALIERKQLRQYSNRRADRAW